MGQTAETITGRKKRKKKIASGFMWQPRAEATLPPFFSVFMFSCTAVAHRDFFLFLGNASRLPALDHHVLGACYVSDHHVVTVVTVT